MHKTKQNKDLLKKIAVAILIIAAMIGISYAVASLVHKNGSVQTSTNVKNGLSAYELAVQQGYTGSLDEWLISLEGKSAYQIAVDNGYSGSEKDWSKTLSAMAKKDKSDISTASFTKNGDLVIVLSDGTKINVGKAVGAKGEDGKDGVGITAAKINEKGELVITYSDGRSVNLDRVVGETVNNGVGVASSVINENGELVLTYTNGEVANLGKIIGSNGTDGKDGVDGANGVGVASAVINDSGELVLSYTDGATANLGKIVGSDGINGTNGADGVSVTSAEINSLGELVLSFSNGQRANVGAVVGAKGDKGDKGEQGLQGVKGDKGDAGLNGVDGIGVKKSEINSLGELVITYTNNLTENLGAVVGAKGDKGDKGDKGEQGLQGVKGDKGDTGLNGTNGTDGVGINDIEISTGGNLVITLTNGTSLNLGNIKGEKGDKGDAGINGTDGIDGTNGADGVGVANSEINALGELVITYSDGNTVNLGKVVGNDGAKGEQGLQGVKGDKGDKGDAGINGTDGIDGTNGADGVGITDVTINADNELVLSFSNGNVINLGNIKGAKGDKGDTGLKGADGINGVDGVGIQNVDVSADGALTVTLTNGTVLNLGNIKGADGLGITKSEINASGELVLTYSNGDVKNLGKVTGENGANGANGADGRGIKSLTLSPDGELVVVMSDNSISNLGNIKGEKGDKGLQGEKGADGRGIAKTELVNGELVITYTDGTMQNIGSIESSSSDKFYYKFYDSCVYLEFTELPDGNLSVKRAENVQPYQMPEQLIIPDTYEGKRVTQIANDAFKYCGNILSVYIPDTVTVIGENAFSYTKLTNGVMGGANVETIKQYAFFGTDKTFENKLNTQGYLVFPNVKRIEFMAFGNVVGTSSDTGSWTRRYIVVGAQLSYINLNGEKEIAAGYYTKGIDKVKYGGTKAQWKSNVTMECSEKPVCTVYCSDGTLEYTSSGLKES